MDKVKTGEVIRNARIEKGYTQQELGDIVGVTNKAVSRWENGDSFPDISQLDSLSCALGIKIEEIVLGKKIVESSSPAVEEIIKVAKIQEKQRTRNVVYGIIGVIILSVIMVQGYNTFIRLSPDLPNINYFYSLAIVLLFVSLRAGQDKNLSLKPDDRIDKYVVILSSVSGIYISIMMITTMNLFMYGNIPFHIGNIPVGKFVDSQLAFIFIMNIILIVFLWLRYLHNEIKTTIGEYIIIAVVYLILVYSNLLHRLDEVEYFISIYSFDVIVVLLITLVMVLATCIYKKHNFTFNRKSNGTN